jgi:hypothetical protein
MSRTDAQNGLDFHFKRFFAPFILANQRRDTAPLSDH